MPLKMLRLRWWSWWCISLALAGGLVAAQEMLISEELETCSTLERATVEQAFGDAADDFHGKVTVLFNVAPPKPVQTPRVFADRDPIHYNKIDYREQINLYHNLYRMFRSQEPYRNGVRFLLSASLHRVPYEVVEYNFTDFFRSVQTLAGGHNFTVYPNHLTENRTFALFGLREFQVYVIDRCLRVSYIIQPPWSLLQYAYVKAAVLSTFYDRPCGKCELENFLNSTVLDDEKDNGKLASITSWAKPYEETSDEYTTPSEDENEDDGSQSEEEDNEHDSNRDRTGTTKDDFDPFANLTVAGPELTLPLRIIIPVQHIHVQSQSKSDNETKESNSTQLHQLHQYIVLHSNDTDRHHHQLSLTPQNDDVKLEELTLAFNSTMVDNPSAGNESDSNNIRIEGTDWPMDQLREILNASSVLYDPAQQRVFERLQRYNLTERLQYDEVSEISVANRYAAWNRRRMPPKTEQPRHNRRSQIKKHYARLIPWLNWTFGKPIPPVNAGKLRASRRLN